MSKYFEESLEVLEDIFHNATFPEKELELYKMNRLHRLEVAQKKNDYIASTRLNGQLFGEHPYGYSANARDVTSLSVNDLFGHYALLRNNNLIAFIAGDVKERHLKALELMLHRLGDGLVSTEGELPEPQVPRDLEIDGPQHLQCAIRMGRTLPTRDHDDYPGLYFLNTIFGGYFGSRLMKNIREEKGLTYGISSSLETLGRAACLHISTEASGENKQVVLDEMAREAEKLRDKPVDKREFEMVRNYIRGNIMMQLDGPFRVIDVVKTLVLECGTTDSFEDFMTGIRSATPESIQKLAGKYLNWDELHKVIVV
jgi:predicted Zn-dependent peptidase